MQGSKTSKLRPRGKAKSPGSENTAYSSKTPKLVVFLSIEIVIYLRFASNWVVRKARFEPSALAIVTTGIPQAATGGPE